MLLQSQVSQQWDLARQWFCGDTASYRKAKVHTLLANEGLSMGTARRVLQFGLLSVAPATSILVGTCWDDVAIRWVQGLYGTVAIPLCLIMLFLLWVLGPCGFMGTKQLHIQKHIQQ